MNGIQNMKFGANCMDLAVFFNQYPDVVIAYSGGIDSTYLLYVAKQYAGNVRAMFVKTAFQPAFELRDAQEFCASRGISIDVFEYDIFQHDDIVSNPANRCYYCKRIILGVICREAENYPGYVVIDGTNADDDENDRPGMASLRELGVLSPLKMCGISKRMIREAAKNAGIALWDKPAYACLATRITHGERITVEKLRQTEYAEDILKSMNFKDVRVRRVGNTAKIQVKAEEFSRFIENRRLIYESLQTCYDAITLDLRARDDE